MNKKKLLHGQAISLQWVAITLQYISADINAGGGISHDFLKELKSVGEKTDLKVVATGCTYVVNFVLPLAIELSLKALLLKEGKEFQHTHNLLSLYNTLSHDVRKELEKKFNKIAGGSMSLKELIEAHKNDFIEWRYLDNFDTLKNEEKNLHFALATILEIYNSLLL